MRSIFISYRRNDTEGQAGRLFDDLVMQFGDGSVFMDVSGIEPGRDFRRAIDEQVASCGVLLAMIGKDWFDAKDESGRRRLDDPQDFVRLETASALKRDIPVIPVLVRGASMPRADQLTPDLAELAYRNAVELTHARWDSDVQVLVNALRPHVETTQRDVGTAKIEPAYRRPSSTSDYSRKSGVDGSAPAGNAVRRKKSWPLVIAISLAAVVLAAVVLVVISYVGYKKVVEKAELDSTVGQNQNSETEKRSPVPTSTLNSAGEVAGDSSASANKTESLGTPNAQSIPIPTGQWYAGVKYVKELDYPKYAFTYQLTFDPAGKLLPSSSWWKDGPRGDPRPIRSGSLLGDRLLLLYDAPNGMPSTLDATLVGRQAQSLVFNTILSVELNDPNIPPSQRKISENAVLYLEREP